MSAETSSKPNIFSQPRQPIGRGLEQIIRDEIAGSGPISFARFMELALYHPEWGYYEKHLGQTGRSGDFYTSVSVGSLYGELLAHEFARLLASFEGPLQLIEGGAHEGQLAHDILSHLRDYHAGLFARLTLIILEPSANRRKTQQEKLREFAAKVQWQRAWQSGFGFRGICFSNELLDAMPIHRFQWSASTGDWIELGVGIEKGALAWKPLSAGQLNALAVNLLPKLPAELAAVLPDGFCVELSPGILNWWASAACALQEGWLFTADYGLTEDELLRPERHHGTLRTYSRHRSGAHPLTDPGSQDITAHINFTQLSTTGERCGLHTEAFEQQGSFLRKTLRQIERAPQAFPLWTPMRYRQLTSLIHPEHLGRAFRILLQRRSAD